MIRVMIEMPKGYTRRRHLNYEKTGFVDLGPIKDVIPVNGGVMPVDYGYIPGTKNEIEQDEIDVLLITEKTHNAGDEVEAEVIALLKREDGDHKVVATDISEIKKWEDIKEELRARILEFFAYHHRIISIAGLREAEEYLAK